MEVESSLKIERKRDLGTIFSLSTISLFFQGKLSKQVKGRRPADRKRYFLKVERLISFYIILSTFLLQNNMKDFLIEQNI